MNKMNRYKPIYRTLFTVALSVAVFAGYSNPAFAVSSVITELENAFTQVAEKSSPAVVNIDVEKKIAAASGMMPFNDPSELFGQEFFERFFGDRFRAPQQEGQQQQQREREYVQRGQGSGFVVSSDGYILTNHHVVGDADRITVKFADGKQMQAKLVGTDPESEVAVVKIDATGLPYLPLGNSDNLKVGQWVVAIGNPFGLSHTLTSGIVSAKGRSMLGITDYEDFIQTDAAINPGNSGGPLLNLDGEVMGINTAILSRSGGYMGVGLAIPSSNVKPIYEQIVENGSVTRGFMGIAIQTLTPELAKSFDLEESKGILVGDVQPDTPAEKAGLKIGDVIISMDGKPYDDMAVFRYKVSLLKPGTEVKLGIVRNGDRKDVPLTIGTLEAETIASGPEATTNQENLGLTIQNLTDELASQLGYENEQGVVITNVEQGSPADRAGLVQGMLIVEANKTPVKDTRQFKNLVEESKEKGSVLLLVKRGQFTSFAVIQLDQS